MIKKIILLTGVMFILFSFVFPTDIQNLKTVAEKSNFTATSKYEDVIKYINVLKKNFPEQMKVTYFGSTTEGRKLPMVILSEEGISRPSEAKVLEKPAVLIMANIHAGEVEGKEASMMLMKDILVKGNKALLKNQIVLIIPIFNADGNEKMSERNRRDDGPKLAGERKNGQGFDLNRDYIKLESYEVRALVTEVFNKWDPVMFVDMHTTNGSYHQEPVTYAPNMAAEGDQSLIDYMWNKALPGMDDILWKKYKVDSIPYGNFIKRDNPSAGWRNGTMEGRFGTCYYGLRNRFSILNENYSHADFKTRVIGSFGFIKAVLEYTSNNILEMKDLIKKADLKSINSVKNSEFPIRFKNVKTYDFTIKSYVFEKIKIKDSERERYPKRWYGDYRVKKTDKKKNYKLPLLSSFEATETVKLTSGYIILPSERKVAELLKTHGICVQVIEEEFIQKVQRSLVKKLETSKSPYQGHFLHRKVEFEEDLAEVTIPKGAYYVSLMQPLSRLIAYMLEPKSRDGLLIWNFFDNSIVRQWRGFSYFPVYKIIQSPKTVMHNF